MAAPLYSNPYIYFIFGGRGGALSKVSQAGYKEAHYVGEYDLEPRRSCLLLLELLGTISHFSFLISSVEHLSPVKHFTTAHTFSG